MELQKLLLERFIDTRNAGFYVNSYTTNMGDGMSEFMKHLRVGIERLQPAIADQEAQLRREARFLGPGPKSLGSNKRAAKMLLRINTAYTKCKHVGGSELVFPILFGHLCYQTHKWGRSIGSIHAVAPDMVAEPESIAHADRGGLALLPKTWCRREGKKVEGPDGTLYESVGKAQEAFLASQSMSKHLPAEDISRLRDFFYSADEIQEVWRLTAPSLRRTNWMITIIEATIRSWLQ